MVSRQGDNEVLNFWEFIHHGTFSRSVSRSYIYASFIETIIRLQFRSVNNTKLRNILMTFHLFKQSKIVWLESFCEKTGSTSGWSRSGWSKTVQTNENVNRVTGYTPEISTLSDRKCSRTLNVSRTSLQHILKNDTNSAQRRWTKSFVGFHRSKTFHYFITIDFC